MSDHANSMTDQFSIIRQIHTEYPTPTALKGHQASAESQ
jgi:hypothetical protein